VLRPGDDAALVATGSEVELALQTAELLEADGISARVVSLPSWEIFQDQPEAVRHRILPPGIPALAVEAASPQGWREFVDDVIGLDRFGASAPAPVLFSQLGFTPEAVAERARALVAGRAR
jgi:transketolase